MGKKKIIIRIFEILFIIMIIISLINIGIWYYDNHKNNEIKEELEELIKVDEDDNNKKYIIDFASLKEKNPDTVAYLKVNNTNIDYVVVQGKDNSYYLKHNFNKEKNNSGWIFMDYHNKLDGNDKNIVIYGHNTRDGSMFGTLRRVITKSWYNNPDNYYVSLFIDNEEKKYQVFSTYSIAVEDYYIKTEFKNDSEFDQFIKKLKSRSVHNYNIDVNKDNRILTLSTCTGNGTRRMVLHAIEIDK